VDLGAYEFNGITSPGEVNGDGRVDSINAVSAIRFVAGISPSLRFKKRQT